ncbi:MAG: epoxyqueuosine reductase QueH [Deltaproteobacteria bacterium]|jgi:predicted adenine nucleotide alpha hydrolase (AANH) superfamily ATPase|nr:epoxyqueuosine reductase QueH [Deltaproteobacteria bacterium]
MSESKDDLTGTDLLFHVCCAPCAVWPIQSLLLKYPGLRLTLWFYNPNIQPLTEFRRRRDALAFLVTQLKGFNQSLEIDFSPPYEQEKFLAMAALNPLAPNRCQGCYELRLLAAAKAALARGFNYFSTTLLFSRQQKHELVVLAGQKAAQSQGLKFYYEDFRVGWKEGRAQALALGLYRQTSCGCVYEAQERG